MVIGRDGAIGSCVNATQEIATSTMGWTIAGMQESILSEGSLGNITSFNAFLTALLSQASISRYVVYIPEKLHSHESSPTPLLLMAIFFHLNVVAIICTVLSSQASFFIKAQDKARPSGTENHALINFDNPIAFHQYIGISCGLSLLIFLIYVGFIFAIRQ